MSKIGNYDRLRERVLAELVVPVEQLLKTGTAGTLFNPASGYTTGHWSEDSARRLRLVGESWMLYQMARERPLPRREIQEQLKLVKKLVK